MNPQKENITNDDWKLRKDQIEINTKNHQRLVKK